MHKPKAFVIITPGFAANEQDDCIPMQCSFVRTLTAHIPDTKIVIISLHYPFKTAHYKWYDAEVFSLNGRNRGGIFTGIIRQNAYTHFRKLNAKYSISGILSFWYGETALIAERMAVKYYLEHRCWILGQDAKKLNTYPMRLKLQQHQLIALSDFIQKEFELNFNVRPNYVIPPGINTHHVSYSEREKDIDIIGIGSLISLKQYDVFIDMIAELKSNGHSVKAVLIGDGPERVALEKKIELLQLEEGIDLKGQVSHAEVLHYLSRSEILLHTSSYEAFGVVCIEALYAGAKVISFVQPMNKAPEGWIYVSDRTEMLKAILSILRSNNEQSQRIPFVMQDTVTSIIKSFDYVDQDVTRRLIPVSL